MSYKEVYEELSLLGEGGMGKVYLVRHRRLGVLRAMKVVRKDDATKLPAEVDILKNLDHQRLPRLHDIYEDDQNIQIIQDYVEGISAKEGIERGGKFDEAHVRKWAWQICEALKYLHTRNPPIIHRDIKPGNIMITPEGDIKLIDFGIAKEYKKDANGPSEHLGTMGYAAPEQYTSAPTDARTDIYSLGITLYHMITGKSPYEPPYELRPIREWNRSYSEGMEYIIQKCTQADPKRRYQSIDELQRDLDNIDDFGNMRERRKRRERLKLAGCFMIFAFGVFLISYGSEITKGERQTAYMEQYDKGIALLSEGELDAAVKTLYSADEYAGRGEGHKAVAAAYMDNGNGSGCLSVIQDTAAKYPEMREDPEFNYYWGLALDSLGNTEEAAKKFEAAEEKALDNVLYMYYLARSYTKSGQDGKAEKMLEKVKATANDGISSFVYAGILAAQNRVDQAAEQYTLCINTAKENDIRIAAYKELVSLYGKNGSDIGMLDKEIDVLQDMRRTYPNDEQAFVLEQLGEAYYTKSGIVSEESGDETDNQADLLRKESISCFNELISLGYGRASTYLNIAIVSQRRADYEGAEKALLQMIDRYPNNSDAYVQMAFLTIEREGAKPQSRRNYSTIKDYYKKAVELGASGEKLQRLEGVMADLKSAGWIR